MQHFLYSQSIKPSLFMENTFATTILNEVSTNYGTPKDTETASGLIEKYKHKEKSDDSTIVVPYSDIVKAFKTATLDNSPESFNSFYQFYVSVIDSIKETLGIGTETVKSTPIKRSNSPNIEVYEYVGHNNMKVKRY